MTRSLLVAGVLALTSACVIEVDDDGPRPNLPPTVVAPLAQCWWAGADGYVWAFDAFAQDPDGAWDVTEVWADVYDVRNGDRYIDSYPLQRTAEADRWYSDWYGWSMPLDCRYDGYVVDVVAYDSTGSFDLFTVIPARSP
jgi:hypothetical protein